MNIGIIGAGIISEEHLAACSRMDEFKVVCAADINRDRVNCIADKYGIKAYENYREMIVKERLDAVIIALPHFLHDEAGVYCMQQGCHVLMEKPMAISTPACDRLIEASIANDRVLMIGHIRYYMEEDRVIQDIMESGRIGRILSINIRRYGDYFHKDRPSWFLDPEMSGGGMLANVGTHEVEKMIRLGGDIRKVSAVAVIKKDMQVEGIVNAVFELDSGAAASISLNGYSRCSMYSLDITGSKGMIREYAENRCVEVLGEGGIETIRLSGGTNPFELQLKDFYNCIINGKKPFLSGEHGRKVIDAVERVYKSAFWVRRSFE